MSRQNKVNPGMYTQRGRLTQDDAARELSRQRSIGSQHTWQPVQRDKMPRLRSTAEAADDDAAVAEPVKTAKKGASRLTEKAKPARKAAKAPAKTTVRAKKKAASSTRVKARVATTKTKAKSAKRRKS